MERNRKGHSILQRVAVFLIAALLVQLFPAQLTMLRAQEQTERVITTPPEWLTTFYRDNYGSENENFYEKAIMIHGIPICSTSEVADAALYKAYDVLEVYLRKIAAERPEIIAKMIENHVHVIIIGLNEYNYEHPAWSYWEDKTERRGGGSVETTVLEEDLDVPESDTWRQQFCGLVHEFSHTCLRYGIGDVDNDGLNREFYARINAAYESAKEAGLYAEESSYDLTNYHEYFCGQVGRWFNGNGTNLNVEDAVLYTEREQLKIYDETIYDICAELYGAYELPSPWGAEEETDELDELVAIGNAIDKKLIVTGYSGFEKVLTEAEKTADSESADAEERKRAVDSLKEEAEKLTPMNGNLAFLAKPSYTYISEWETENAVNDGYVSALTNGDGTHFGSYGNYSSMEAVTYRFISPVKINSSDLFFWEDGGGIKLPASYDYYYRDAEGTWKKAENASGLTVDTDKFSTTVFDTVTTDAIRVVLRKQEASYDGVGLSEWQVSQNKAAEPDTPIDPDTPIEPEEPIDPDKPIEPEEPIDPDKPIDPEEPIEPDQPDPQPTEDSRQLTDCKVVLEETGYTYTGKRIKPAVTITNVTGTVLRKGKDYTVSYKNNLNAGTASIVIKGKGKIKGKLTASFTIAPAVISNDSYIVSFSPAAAPVYTGKELKPKFTVRSKTTGKKLPVSAFTVSYSSNIQHTTEAEKGIVTLTGRKNHTGTVTAEFEIAQKDFAKKSGFKLKLGKPEYSAEKVILKNPELLIKYKGMLLVENVDYRTEFTYDTEKNRGYLKIAGMDGSNFTGERTIKFKIVRNAIYKQGET